MKIDSRLIKTISSQYLGRIIKILLTLILGPILARYLGPEKLGKLAYVSSISVFLFPFIDFGARETLGVFLTKNIKKKELVNTTFLIQIFGTTSVSIILFLFALLSNDPDLFILFILEIFHNILIYGDIFEKELLHLREGPKIARVLIVKELTYFLLSLSAIYLRAELYIFSLIQIISGALRVWLLSILNLSSIRLNFVKFYKKKIANMLLRRGFPLILSGFTEVLLLRIDQVMIQAYLGSEQLGYYSVAVKAIESLYFLPAILSQSYLPLIGTKDLIFYKNINLRNFYKLTWILGIFITFVSIFLLPIVVKVLYGVDYLSSIPSLIWLGSAGFSVCIGFSNSLWLRCSNLENVLWYRAIIALIFNTILNLLLIPKEGIVGAAKATTIANYLGIFLINIIWTKKSRYNIIRNYFPF